MENLTIFKLNRRRGAVHLALTTGLALLFFAVLLWGLQGVPLAGASPGTLYVDGASGSDTGDCTNLASPCATIGHALSEATSGDEILIAEDIYTETLFIEDLALRGGYEAAGWTRDIDAHLTVINANGTDSVVVNLGANGTTLLEGFVIRGANHLSDDGGGLFINGGTVVISATTVLNNHTGGGSGGGGVFIEGAGANVSIVDTTFISNTADAGGGGVFSCCMGGSGQILLDNVEVLSNSAQGSGGGLNLSDGTITVTNSTILNNNSTWDGGGIAVYGPGVQLLMESVQIANNQAGETTPPGQGGGLYLRGGAQAVLNNVQLHDNTAGESGGGMRLDDPGTSVTITNSQIFSNTALVSGGGVSLQNDGGVLNLSGSSILGNAAPNGAGGGIEALSGAIVNMVDSIIADNTTKDHGGGVSASQATVNLTNALITGNETTSDNANVFAIDDSNVTVMNSTISDNNPQGAQAVILWSGTLTMTNSIMWNNALNLQGDPPCPTCFVVTYSDIEGGWTGTGNINADPLFVGVSDYRLQTGSLCIDAGTNTGAPDHDLDQKPRPQDGDGDGTATTDIGAYEFVLYRIYLPLTLAEE